MTGILLVNTLQHDFSQGDYSLGNSRKNQPLDLALAAAVLREAGFKVKIIDANLKRIPHEEVANISIREKPSWVIINTASIDRWECPLPTVKEPELLAKTIKEKCPKTKIIAIGPHGTITPDWFMEKCPSIDFLVRGEPEQTLLELTGNKLLSKITGLTFRENGKILNNSDRPYLSDLDSLPLPAYDLLPMDEYGPLGDHFNGNNLQGETSPFSIMVTSKGCPGLCTFCLRKMFQDRRTFRFPKVEKTVTEIELLVKKFKIKAIYFQDLNFVTDQKRVVDLCDLILKKRLVFSWGCEARFDFISPPLLAKMKKAGCSFINFGLESGSEKVLQLCQKNTPIKTIERAINDCRQAGIAIGCFKLLGLPGEDRQSFIETLEFMINNQIEIPYPFPINKPLPYPGTLLHQQAEKQFNQKISWEDAPQFAGKVGTNFFDQVSLAEIQFLTYKYKLKQLGKPINKHFLKLLAKYAFHFPK